MKNTAEFPLLTEFKKHLPANFNLPKSRVEKKLFIEYGALFISGDGVVAPESVIFKNEAEVQKWQKAVGKERKIIAGFVIELQTAAMKSLELAICEAERANLTITPRGADAARRSYADTEKLWASRVNPALEHWTEQGKLSPSQADEILSMSPFDQIPEIFKLEDAGMFCSKDLSKSIIYSVAPPGASQHLAMLALDINEFNNFEVRRIMAKHRWFQTVVSDLPHFTYLGKSEEELPAKGLKKITDGDRVFWVPNL